MLKSGEATAPQLMMWVECKIWLIQALKLAPRYFGCFYFYFFVEESRKSETSGAVSITIVKVCNNLSPTSHDKWFIQLDGFKESESV